MDRLQPRFNMQLRWNERWNRWTIANSNTGNVAAENIVFPVINVVMTGVTRRRNGPNFKRRHTNDFVVFQNLDPLHWHRRNFSPESFHVAAEDSRRRLYQLCRIDQMRCATGMYINSRRFREPPRRARVVEMNVAQKNMANVFGIETGFAKIANDVIERRF